MSNIGKNIRNMYVLKDQVSEFQDFRLTNEILKDCEIIRILPSGNYYIFTFSVTPEQKDEIKKIQDNWI